MTVLSDNSIKRELESKRIIINPLDYNDIQPASVDLHLSKDLRVFTRGLSRIDVRSDLKHLTKAEEIHENAPFLLHSGAFILGSTVEWVEIADDLVARIEGKSSLGRLGLLVHSTAGYVDPGWKGDLTLELFNCSPLPITLYRGMPIGQISFLNLSTKADRPYGSKSLRSKYQGQTGPTASRINEDFHDC